MDYWQLCVNRVPVFLWQTARQMGRQLFLKMGKKNCQLIQSWRLLRDDRSLADPEIVLLRGISLESHRLKIRWWRSLIASYKTFTAWRKEVCCGVCTTVWWRKWMISAYCSQSWTAQVTEPQNLHGTWCSTLPSWNHIKSPLNIPLIKDCAQHSDWFLVKTAKTFQLMSKEI